MTNEQMLAKLMLYTRDMNAALKDAQVLVESMTTSPYKGEAETRQAEFAASGIAVVGLCGSRAQNQISSLEQSYGITNILVALYLLGFGDGAAHQASAELRKLVEETK